MIVKVFESQVGEWGCKVVMNMTAGSNASNRVKQGEAGVYPVLCEALSTHISSAMIAEKGFTAIYNLTANNAGNKLRLNIYGAANTSRQIRGIFQYLCCKIIPCNFVIILIIYNWKICVSRRFEFILMLFYGYHLRNEKN